MARSSQHVFLSSQTLGDVIEAVPCASNEIPEEMVNEQGVTEWQKTSTPTSSGAAICLEDTVYGDRQGETDYSE